MKTIQYFYRIPFRNKMKRIIIKQITYFTLIAFLNLFSACSHYFRVVVENPYSAQSIKQFDEEDKYLVLHRGNDAWHMYDLQIINDSIQAKLDFQLGYQANYLDAKEKGLNKYYKKIEPEVINAVHIYTIDSSFIRHSPRRRS